MNSPKNLALVVLALAAVGGAVIAWKLQLELQALRAAALAGDERAELTRRALAAEKRAKDLAAELGVAQEKLSEAKTAVAKTERPKPAEGTGPGPNIRTMVGNAANLMNSPEMQRMMALNQRAALDGNYAKMFKQLNLSPEKLDQLKKLMVERQSVANDVFGAAIQQGLDPMQSRREIAKMSADAQGKVDGEIRSLLGDADFASYQNYQATLPQRGIVNQLAQSLSYTPHPLSDSQADQLVQILAQHPPARAAGAPGVTDGQNVRVNRMVVTGTAGGGGELVTASIGPGMAMGMGALPISDGAVAASRSVLNEPQVEALQQMQQQQAQLRSAMQSMGGPPGTGSGAVFQFSTSTSGSPPPPPPAGDKPPGGG